MPSAAAHVRMELHKIIISDLTPEQIIVLREQRAKNGHLRTFPIVIGTSEAAAIDRRLKGQVPSRPMTHDLLANVVEKLGGNLLQIEITHLENHVFYANLLIELDGGKRRVEVDSRPSDAIALGVARNVPIYVAERVLDQVCGDPNG